MRTINLISRSLLTAFICTSSYAATVSSNCTVSEEIFNEPVGDQSGKIVVTGKKVFRQCVDRTIVKGDCLEWEVTADEYKVGRLADIAKIEMINSGNIGDALTVLGAVSQTDHMFNGVKGRCVYGIAQDFSWLEDPMFYAGLLMDYLGSDQFQDSYVNEYQDAKGVVQNAEKAKTAGVLNQGYTVAPKYTAFAQMYSQYGSYAICAVSATADMMGAAQQFYSDDSECDPVDEFCGAENGGTDDPGLVQTLSVAEFNQLIAQDSTIMNYIQVLDDGSSNGYVTFRIVDNANAVLDNTQTQQQIQAARDQAKLKTTQIKVAISGVKAAACLGSAAMDSNTPPDDSGGGNSTASQIKSGGLQMGISMLLPFPYNSLATIALKLFQSFQSVDSCSIEDDANAQGQRHVIAYRGLRFGTCHEILNPSVKEKSPIGTPMLHERNMCCFDSETSKILMTQMHAQVGKGWAHCTGISLNELAHISWRQCSASEMSDGFDGARVRGVEGSDYSMKDSFQYKNQCMDLAEFKNYIESQIPANYDNSQVMEMLQHMTSDLTESIQ